LKEGLELLYALQRIDDEIKEVKNLLIQIPIDIKEVEKERDSKKDIIDKSKEKLEANIKEREKLEKDILNIKEEIKKYREQMNKVTTNKEYQGFIAEIKYQEERMSTIEEKIIEKMLEADSITEEIRDSEKEFDKIAEDYNVKIKKMKENLDYHKNKLNQLNVDREELKKKISPRLITIYENIFKNKGGKAVSLIKTEFCEVCNIKIRPQILSDIITTDEIYFCENCGRILYKKIEEENQEEKK